MSSIISCKGLTKQYVDGTRRLDVLNGVDLEVEEGKILAISGPSGVGKSTLLHLMGTLDRPTGGDIHFQGQNLARLRGKALARLRNEQIGFVFQFYHLLPEFTALENVMMPSLCKGASRAACLPRAEELLLKVKLSERMTHKPGQLSGGEQQRVAIARALYNNPSVVLTDEPTGNLDEHTGEGVIELLWDLNRSENVTLVIVTHDEQLAARADAWVRMHEGRAYPKE